MTTTARIHASQGSASVLQTDAMGDSMEVAHLDDGNYFGEVSCSVVLELYCSNRNASYLAEISS